MGPANCGGTSKCSGRVGDHLYGGGSSVLKNFPQTKNKLKIKFKYLCTQTCSNGCVGVKNHPGTEERIGSLFINFTRPRGYVIWME